MNYVAGIFALVILVAGGYFMMTAQEPEPAASANVSLDTFGAAANVPQAPTPNVQAPQQMQALPELSADDIAMKATLHTNQGPITIEFMNNLAPETVENFQKLARAGFYDGTKFHRVIAGFMIQGGDPLSKDEAQAARWGTGGPGYTFGDEIHAENKNAIGTIAMANAGPNTNGSQFFINVAANNFLDAKHTVFGTVTAGMETVKAIETTATGPGDRPVTPMIIERVTFE